MPVGKGLHVPPAPADNYHVPPFASISLPAVRQRLLARSNVIPVRTNSWLIIAIIQATSGVQPKR